MRKIELILVDTKPEIIKAWQKEFIGYEIKIEVGDIFTYSADAVVSPANSTGIMDGGFDFYLREFFGLEIERTVRIPIYNQYDGELPVGQALITKTGNERFPYLITAPTMRTPGDVSKTINAYLAMSAILRVSMNHTTIKTVICSGLCSLSGRMPYKIMARQMRAAYDRVVLKKYFYPHWIYEVDFERYLRCEIENPPNPDDYENKKV